MPYCIETADGKVDNGTQFTIKGGITAWPTQYNSITWLTTILMSSAIINY
jgi:hypothetical protein